MGGWYEMIVVTVRLRLCCFLVSLDLFRVVKVYPVNFDIYVYTYHILKINSTNHTLCYIDGGNKFLF